MGGTKCNVGLSLCRKRVQKKGELCPVHRKMVEKVVVDAIWMQATQVLCTKPHGLEWAVKSNLPIIPCLSYRVGYVNGKLVEKELVFKNKHYTKKAPTLADLFGAASLDA